jgi:hypothetical protein
LQKIKYKIEINDTVKIKLGTIKELISIKPFVSLSKNIEAIPNIINDPTIFGKPKNWFIKAPLPAKIIEALEIKYIVVIAPVILPNRLGLIIINTSL